MANLNQVQIIGNITRDIEVKYLQSGMAVCELGLAVNDKYKNKQGEMIEKVTFIDVTLWGRTAEVASEYLHKGSSVYIGGRLDLETWEKDGQKRSKLKVTGENLQMLGSKPSGQSQQRRERQGEHSQAPPPLQDDQEYQF